MRIDPELAASLVRSALKKGADLAEVYVKRSRSLRAEVKEARVSAVENSEEFGYSLRVIRNNRLGFSYSNDPAEADKVAGWAMDSLAFTKEDAFLDLPSPEEGGHYPVLDTFDPAIDSMDAERAVSYAKEIEKAAFDSDRRVNRTRKSSAAFSSYEVSFLNSKGISFGYEATSASASISAVADEKGDSQVGWGYEGGRFLSGIDFGKAGRDAARRACSMLGATRAKPLKASLIIENSVAVDFLSVAAAMMSADNVQKGKSLLEGREGRQILSKLVNITDNPLAAGSPALRPMDGEGLSCRKNVFVSEGVLLGFMHNTYTARKAGTRSTGNASRGGAHSLPGVGALSMIIEPASGTVSVESMVRSVDMGMIVTDAMGVHTINPVSGEFSIGVSGISVRGGKPDGPVKEAVISGNILELLGSIAAVGDDLKYFGSMGSPSLLVPEVDLSA